MKNGTMQPISIQGMSAAAFFDGGLVIKIVARSVSGYGTDLKFLYYFSFNPVFELKMINIENAYFKAHHAHII